MRGRGKGGKEAGREGGRGTVGGDGAKNGSNV